MKFPTFYLAATLIIAQIINQHSKTVSVPIVYKDTPKVDYGWYKEVHGYLTSDTSVIKRYQSWFTIPLQKGNYSNIKLYDPLLVAKRDSSGLWTIYNAASALNVLYEENEKLRAKFEAAYKILNYMKTDGTITNWKKWTEAVREYQALTERKHSPIEFHLAP